MSSTSTMPHFDLHKGSKFSIDKGIRRVRIGLAWDAGDNLDPDASLFGLVHLPNGNPKFYNNASHAVFYANDALKQKDGTLRTTDGSIIHSGDDRTGGKGGDDEVITVDFSLLPAEIVELAVWVTIYDAHKKKQAFGQMQNSQITVTDADTQGALCQYKLRDEFGTASSVQVGSFVKNGSNWEFQAVGAGTDNELGAILDQYS